MLTTLQNVHIFFKNIDENIKFYSHNIYKIFVTCNKMFIDCNQEDGKSSWIWITICIWKKFVNLKDVQEFDCFSYFEKVHEFEKRRTEKWKRKTAPEKTCGTFYPWDEKNKNRCERGQTLFGALSARYRVNGTGCTPPCPRWAGPQSFLSALKKAKKKADTLLGFFHNSQTSPFPRMARPLNSLHPTWTT